MEPIAHYLDYTALKPGVTEAQIRSLCQEARAHEVAAACVPPCYVSLAAQCLEGSAVQPCTVVGFPHGLHLSATKLTEARQLIESGATELDWVSNLSALRNHDYDYLRTEIEAFAQLCQAHQIVSKVIIESGLLDDQEVAFMGNLCAEAGVDFVKTSTGFAAVGAELEKVALLRNTLPDQVAIKASGGIRDWATARAFIEAGATRLGTSTLIVEPS